MSHIMTRVDVLYLQFAIIRLTSSMKSYFVYLARLHRTKFPGMLYTCMQHDELMVVSSFVVFKNS
jgi:hypothetical protein